MLRRKVYSELMDWKGRSDHKCLLVKGQRQVGKTFIIDVFARENYENVIYSDISKEPEMRDALSGTSVEQIINRIKLAKRLEDIDPENTVLIFDEIQVSRRARGALKMFTLDGRYDVIASGSILGVTNPDKRRIPGQESVEDGDGNAETITDEESYVRALDHDETVNEMISITPMGYEEHLTMYSLDFEEFLWANGVPQSTIDEVRGCIHNRTPLPDSVLRAMDGHFRDYMIVGGMPEAVKAFVEGDGDYTAAGRALRDAISNCLMDFKNYNPPIMEGKILDCFYSIPVMLSQDNKKFMYSGIRSGTKQDESGSIVVPGNARKGTSEKYDSSIIWLKQAGYTNFCYALLNISHPLEACVDRKSFKVYMSDTGMLNSLLGIQSIQATYSWMTGYNKGAIAENAVAEGIRKCGLPVRYYIRTENKEGRRMEIDFVLELGKDLIAVEVKSGKDRKAPSLGKVQSVFEQVNRRIVLSRTNIYTDGDGIEHYPLFAACFADELGRKWEGPEFVAFRES